jgi:hypothetical protein
MSLSQVWASPDAEQVTQAAGLNDLSLSQVQPARAGPT